VREISVRLSQPTRKRTCDSGEGVTEVGFSSDPFTVEPKKILLKEIGYDKKEPFEYEVEPGIKPSDDGYKVYVCFAFELVSPLKVFPRKLVPAALYLAHVDPPGGASVSLYGTKEPVPLIDRLDRPN